MRPSNNPPVFHEDTAWRGQWNIATVYFTHDAVRHEGSSYICVQNNTGTAPDPLAITPWDLIVEKADTGPQGIQGIQGDPGPQGIPGEIQNADVSVTPAANKIVKADADGKIAVDWQRRMQVTDRGLWVSPNGDDAQDGLSGGNAKRTLAAALTAAGSSGGEINQLGSDTFSTPLVFPVTPNGGIVVRGRGRGPTTLTYTGTGKAISFGDGGASDAQEQYVEDLTLIGTASADGAVEFNHTRFCGLRRVKLLDFTKAGAIGVNMTGGQHNYFNVLDHVIFRNIPTGAKLGHDGTLGGNSNHLVDCWFGVHSTMALDLDGRSNLIERCEFNGSTAVGASIGANARDNLFLKDTFDGPTSAVSINALAEDTIFIGTSGLSAGVPAAGVRTIVLGAGVANLLDLSIRRNLLLLGDGAVSMESMTSINNVVLAIKAAAEAQRRFYMRGTGEMNWGGGSAAPDTQLKRVAANILGTGTGDKFTAAAGIGVGNSAAATTPGTVTKKMEVFDASGTSLGFVPIYDAIT